MDSTYTKEFEDIGYKRYISMYCVNHILSSVCQINMYLCDVLATLRRGMHVRVWAVLGRIIQVIGSVIITNHNNYDRA